MENNIDKKIEFKDRLIPLFNNNKLLVYAIITILVIIIFSTTFYILNDKKKNNVIAEKYIQAGLYLSSNKNEQSKKLYEEIILSENKFYSILALNIILEKNLISDKNKVLDYFQLIETTNKSKEHKDLIVFKKALYLIKTEDVKKGNKLLKNLIDNNSKLKFLAEEVIIK